MSLIIIQNPIASAVVAEEVHLVDMAHESSELIRAIQSGQETETVKMWRPHILWLMLFRDCCGREMHRRGMTVAFPPMLARGWESWDMYDLSNTKITYPGCASEAL